MLKRTEVEIPYWVKKLTKMLTETGTQQGYNNDHNEASAEDNE